VSSLKIDQSFVGRMTMDEESMGIVETIITLAQKLKMAVVAEGIETDEQRQKLIALNCVYGQGYLFSRPVSADAAIELITTGVQPGPDFFNVPLQAPQALQLDEAYPM